MTLEKVLQLNIQLLEQLQEKNINLSSISIDNALLDNKIEQSNIVKGDVTMQLKHGQGSMRKRTRTTKTRVYTFWEARWVENGIPKSTTAATQLECYNKLKQATKALKNNNRCPSLTVKHWIDEWMTIYKIPQLAPNSIKSMSNCITLYINPKIGNINIRTIKPKQIQALCINTITAPRQRQITFNILNAAFRQAVVSKLIKENPCVGVQCAKAKSKPTKVLTKAQQMLLIESTSDELLQDIILCYLWTGCRRNELLGLTTNDIDLSNRTITIRGTKTNSSFRVIPIFDPIYSILKKRAAHKTIFDITPDNLNHKFNKICTALGFEGVTIHSLRHTFATNAFERGIAIKTVQAWLGHSSYKTTADIYTHLTKGFIQTEIDKMK